MFRGDHWNWKSNLHHWLPAHSNYPHLQVLPRFQTETRKKICWPCSKHRRDDNDPDMINVYLCSHARILSLHKIEFSAMKAFLIMREYQWHPSPITQFCAYLYMYRTIIRNSWQSTRTRTHDNALVLMTKYCYSYSWQCTHTHDKVLVLVLMTKYLYSYSWQSTRTCTHDKVLVLVLMTKYSYSYSWQSTRTHDKVLVLVLMTKYSYSWQSTRTHDKVLVIMTKYS